MQPDLIQLQLLTIFFAITCALVNASLLLNHRHAFHHKDSRQYLD